MKRRYLKTKLQKDQKFCKVCGKKFNSKNPFEWFIHDNKTGGGCIFK
ncbi:hypothetical protein [Bacillus mycoides]|nr:hypothetical protein [Bacillus mycoides]HDR7566335.1 hypothetical protein [Bacillus mycoides]